MVRNRRRLQRSSPIICSLVFLLAVGSGLGAADPATAPAVEVIPGPDPLPANAPAVIAPATPAPAPAPGGAASPDIQRQLDELRSQLQDLRAQVADQRATTTALTAKSDAADNGGESGFNFGGYATIGIDDLRYQGADENVAFNPLITYAWRDDVLFTGQLALSTQDAPQLAKAYIAYTGFEHVVVELGLFPLPFGTYSEREAMDWINPFADAPPPTYGEAYGVFSADQSDVGVQLRGETELGGLRATGILFAVAGPTYNASDGSDDRLEFGANSSTSKTPPTAGARIGVFPIPGGELGVSAMFGAITNNVPAYNAGNPGQLDPTQGLIVPPVAPSGNAFNPDATYDQSNRRDFFGYAIDAEYHRGGLTLRGEGLLLNLDDSAGQRLRTKGFYVEAAERMDFLSGWLAGWEGVLRAGAVYRNLPLWITDYHGNPATITDIRELDAGVNYHFSGTIRSSLFVLIHSDHMLDQASFVTTIGF
jgi:hypothetical protein